MSPERPPSGQELMAVALSRRLESGWIGIAGAASTVPIAAILLARRRHAPGLNWVCSATGFINPEPERLYRSSTQFEYRSGATSVIPYSEIACLFERGFDFGFFGGLEIDRLARANTVVTSSGRPGPGPAGLPVGMSRTRNVFLYIGRHSLRALVESVKHETGLPAGNVRSIVTPLCEFEVGETGPVLAALLTGELEGIRQATGFHFEVRSQLERLTPSQDELEILREIDSGGLLRAG